MLRRGTMASSHSVENGASTREIGIGEIETGDGSKVEITAPGLRMILTPAAAEKLLLWIDQWITDSAGDPPVVTTGSRSSRQRFTRYQYG